MLPAPAEREGDISVKVRALLNGSDFQPGFCESYTGFRQKLCFIEITFAYKM